MSYAQLMMDHVQLVHKHVMLRADIHHLAADLRDLLSFIDEETKDTGYQEATKKAPGDRTMSQSSPLEHGPLPDVHPLRYEEGVAQMATALCGIGSGETSVSRRKRSSEV